jgi:hypothetical protein
MHAGLLWFSSSFDRYGWPALAVAGIVVLGLMLLAYRRLARSRPVGVVPPSPLQDSLSSEILPAGVSADRRRVPRRWGNALLVHVSDATAQADPVEGVILNRSEGGLCLALHQAVVVGTNLNVRVATAPSSIPWTAVEVKYCLRFVSRWKVGCQFVQPPSAEVLLMFG